MTFSAFCGILYHILVDNLIDYPFPREEIFLNKLHDAIDRFCATHRNFGIYNLMRYVVIAQLAVYALYLLTGQNFTLIQLLALDPARVLQGQIWRLVTFVFVPPFFSVLSLAISLYFYYWIGNVLEDYWGTGKFTLYYISGVVLTIIASFLAYFLGGGGSIAGLHYVNMAMFLAYALLNPDAYVYFFFILPIRIKWLAWLDILYFAVDVLMAIGQGSWGAAMAPVVALLNFFVFFAPYFSHQAQVARRQNSRQAVNFKKAVREQQRDKGYNHKCEICGRTDTDYPDLQFRYCSKCEGYHCYCEEHIYNHQHHES